MDFHKRDTNDIGLGCVANAEIDNDGNVRAREREKDEGRDRIFSRPIIYERFPKCNTPATQRRGGAIVHFFIRAGAPATHLRGEKRVARPPGISSDILFMKHLIYTGA